MTPPQFQRQVREALRIDLTNGELAALVTKWDSDGDGTIDSTEFLVNFFKLKVTNCAGGWCGQGGREPV